MSVLINDKYAKPGGGLKGKIPFKSPTGERYGHIPEAVFNVLNKYGSDAHLYTFGPGVPILGPELVVNGDGAAVTGWMGANATLSVQAGEICNTGTGPLYPEILQDFGTVAGREYLVTGSSRRGTSANPAWALAKRKLGAANLTSSTANSSQVSAPFSFKFVAQDDQSRISLVQSSGTADTGTVLFDNISVREILGYSNTYSGFSAGNYFDSAGTTHASVDGSVGLVLDAAGSVGADLLNGAGSFDSPTGWATQTGWSVTGGQLVASNAAQFSNTQRTLSLVQGKTYKVTLTCTSTTGGTYYVVRPDTTNGPNWTGVGTNSFIYTHGSGVSNLYVATSTAGFTATFDSLTVQEVTGIHASQQTVGYKPLERRGIVNLLTYSNDLSNLSGWNVSNVTTTASSIKPDTSTSLHRVLHISSITSGVPYTAAVRASANGYRYLYVNGAASGGKGQVCFDLQAGVVAAVSDGVGTIAPVGDGSYLCCVSSTSASTSNALYLQVNNSANAYDTVFAGDGVGSINCYASGLFAGTLTAAQIIAAGGIPLTTTAPASSQAGVNYLEFVDTSVQHLKRPPASVGASGWAVVAVAASKLANMSPMGSLGTSNEVGYAGYAFKLRTNGDVWLRVGDGSGVQGNISELLAGAGTYQVGRPIVLSMRWSAGGRLVGRVNGVDIGSVLCVNPSGPNGGVVIGAHNAVPNEYFAGKVFFNQDGVGAISAQDIAMIEKQAAAAAGIQL